MTKTQESLIRRCSGAGIHIDRLTPAEVKAVGILIKRGLIIDMNTWYATREGGRVSTTLHLTDAGRAAYARILGGAR